MEVYRALLALLLFGSFVSAADSKFSATHHERHTKLGTQITEHDKALYGTLFEREYLFGDWQGIRTYWAKRGVTITSNNVTILLYNPFGGLDQGVAYSGSTGLNFTLDLEKMYNLRGLELYAGFVIRQGSSLTANDIGNQFPVQQNYGNQSYIVDTIYLKQTLQNGKTTVKLGRLNGGDDFFQDALYYNFISNAFCGNPIAIFFNVPFSAYPNAQWGAYIDHSPSKKLKFKYALYNTDPLISQIRFHGMHLTFDGQRGLFQIAEADYLTAIGDLKLGFWYANGTFERFLDTPVTGDWGTYFHLDHKFSKTTTAFITTLLSPSDRNQFPLFFTTGVIAKGWIDYRPDDISVVGVGYGSYSSDLRESQRAANVPTQNFEMVIEVNHKFQFTKWFFMQPDLQIILKPSGYTAIADAFVLGFQSGLTF